MRFTGELCRHWRCQGTAGAIRGITYSCASLRVSDVVPVDVSIALGELGLARAIEGEKRTRWPWPFLRQRYGRRRGR